MYSSSFDWLTSPSCTLLAIDSSSSTPQLIVQWLRFIFLSPCPQRLLLSAIDFLFLLSLLAFAAHRLYSRLTSNRNSTPSITKPLLQEKDSDYRVTFWFKLPLLVTFLLAIAYTVLGILAFTQSNFASWKQIEALFRLFQAIVNIVIVILMVHEKKFKATKHPLTLRIYWVANFVVACLFAASAIFRFVTVDEPSWLELSLRIDDIFSLVNLPLSLFFLIIAIKESSGIQVIRISDVVAPYQLIDRTLSPYANASFLSKTVWYWMNPLISKGYKEPLKLEDVPSLPIDFKAEKMSDLFQSNWPKPEESSKHPVGTTLFRCFWKHIAFTGFLAIIRLCVMYIGPILIQSFVDFTSRKDSTVNEGIVLILILFAAKSVEVLSVHQFNFHSQKLGMLIRSSLITSVYKKGLRLSSSSRQTHGTGQIVNHMAVDAQQLADLMMQFHPIWMMPIQVAAALALMYYYVGLSVIAAVLGTTLVFCFTLYRTKSTNSFQFKIMMSRDLRMKATNELLNNMRVIKFQAWEEYFGNKIRKFREAEHGWIGKFLYYFAVNMGVLSTGPLAITVLTFGTATFLGIPLNAGTVFTITSVIKILQEPVRTFPQALIQISQAVISLGRLDEFMMSKEMDENAVERMENCEGDIAIEIKDGKFSWDDKEENEELRVEELEIKKGEHAAVVGTVGSGKSSLLASVLGEMFKISGKVRVCGTTAYVAQTSWIQNETIQENILFGLPMNMDRYREVVRVCCLEKDLEMMEHGDQTEIGERGINLSGGQKQRIQLARAVYQDSDIYLLDDVFSAVDAQTGSFIFKECIMGTLKDKTVLLVTHQIDFLHNVQTIMASTDILLVDIQIPMLVSFVMLAYLSLLSILVVTCQNSWPTVFLLFPLIWLDNTYRVSTDILWVDIQIPMLVSFVMIAYLSLLSILVVTCQNSWPTVFLLFPLIWLDNTYRGCVRALSPPCGSSILLLYVFSAPTLWCFGTPEFVVAVSVLFLLCKPLLACCAHMGRSLTDRLAALDWMTVIIAVVCIIGGFFILTFFALLYIYVSRRIRRYRIRQGFHRSLEEGRIVEFLYDSTIPLPVGHDTECSCCLENFENNQTLYRLVACQHIYHKDCGDKWFVKSETCPICRTMY